MESRISGHTGLLALFGSPVSHSGSPAMYNYSFQRLGLDYAYVAIDVKEDDMAQALDSVRLFNMRGCNITMPGKTAAVACMDDLSPAAKLIGAVNTVVNDNGVLHGHNTDGVGFVRNLKEHGVEVAGKKITIAGGGGAATAIQVQCALDGVKEISIFNKKDRFYDAIIERAEKIKAEVPAVVINVYDIDDEEKFKSEIAQSDILVNATSVGMAPNEDNSIIKDTSVFRSDLVVCDVVYNPVETKMLREAKEAGCKVVGGKGMLLWQGVEAFRLYTGQEMPVEEVKERFFS